MVGRADRKEETRFVADWLEEHMVNRWYVACCVLVVALFSHAPSPSAMQQAAGLTRMRMTPAEVRANQTGSEQIGSSAAAGVSTKILFGDPSKSGFYVIVLSVPAHTTIAAHSHRDDRMATVVAGTWQFGYGDRFDARELKSLPVGSVYSEPGGVTHFARTDADAVLVEISGFGPTDTRYFNPADTPKPAPAK
jgi:quercetin dioxygenase-like cupin family protein